MHVDSHPIVELMNRAGFNLSAVGNHEFDGRVEGLRSMVNNSNFRYVCANVFFPDSMRVHVQPYKVFEVDGVRIGALGLLQTGANGLPDTHPDNLKDIVFRQWEKVADQYSWLRDQCQVFLLLVHEEYDECVEFLENYPYADVLIGAHTHKPIYTTELHNGVMITQADYTLKYVTHITLQVTDGVVTGKESRLLDVNAFSSKNDEVQAMVDEYNNNDALLRVLTQAITDFDNKEELGCMMTDAIRKEAGADVAIQNPGGVRLPNFPKGSIAVRDIYRLDPFGNEVVAFNLTGEELLRLIKAAYIAENKQPPYVSGITLEMTTDAQGKIRKMQVKMENGSRFNLRRTYKVVMNSYIAAVSQYEKADPGESLYITSAAMTIQYLEKQPAVDYKGVKRMRIEH
jgi:5'-nucleotidase